MFMALSLVVSLSEKALLKGLAGMLAGLMFSLIGMDPISGTTRLTFGIPDLIGGVNFIAVVIGLFAFGEIFVNLETQLTHIYDTPDQGLAPDLAGHPGDLGHHDPLHGRRLLPGAPAGVRARPSPRSWPTTWRSASPSTRSGSARGPWRAWPGRRGPTTRAAARSSSRSWPSASPPGPTLAMLLGALMMYGIQPGPRLWTEQPQLVWSVIASMYIGNVMLLILNLPLVGFWARIAFIPFPILGPLIVVFSLIGGLQRPLPHVGRLGLPALRGDRLPHAEVRLPPGPRGPGDDPLPAAGDRAQAGDRHLGGLLRDLLHPPRSP